VLYNGNAAPRGQAVTVFNSITSAGGFYDQRPVAPERPGDGRLVLTVLPIVRAGRETVTTLVRSTGRVVRSGAGMQTQPTEFSGFMRL
jgi:hypothetical protein